MPNRNMNPQNVLNAHEAAEHLYGTRDHFKLVYKLHRTKKLKAYFGPEHKLFTTAEWVEECRLLLAQQSVQPYQPPNIRKQRPIDLSHKTIKQRLDEIEAKAKERNKAKCA